MEPLVVSSEEEFATVGAKMLAEWMQEAVDERSRVRVALSGGSTPGSIYDRLGEESIDWERVTILLADDRCVPPDHASSNQRLIGEHLLKGLPRPPKTIFPDTRLPPAECARDYAERVQNLLGTDQLDVLVLGMGEDGHIASLFPPVEARESGNAAAVHTTTDRFDVRDRVSLSLSVLAAARHVLLLLKGSSKLEVFDRMRNAPYDPRRWPLQEVMAENRVNVLVLA